MVQAAILVIFPMLVAFGGASDLLTMTIQNRVSLLLIAGFAILAVATGLPLQAWGMHALAFAVVFAPCFLFFAFGWMGGGDVKFSSAIALWIGFSHELLMFVLFVAVYGMFLTLGLLALRQNAVVPSVLYRQEWFARLHDSKSGIPYGMGIVRNQYMGRTFIEPTEQIRNMGVRLKLNVNRALIEGKRVILVDDSVVRGTTSRKIKEMILDAGAAEVHFRIASPPTAWPCFYGVDTPQREKLLAATMSEDEMRDHLQVDSLRFISLDGLYRAVGEAEGRNAKCPQYCDACFSGEYPVTPADMIEKGFKMKTAAE